MRKTFTDLYTRRTALQLLGGTLASATIRVWPAETTTPVRDSFDCFAWEKGPRGAGLYVFKNQRANRELVSFAPVNAPSAITISSDRRLVLATSSAPVRGSLPTGSLLSYSLSEKGALCPLSSKNLSFSATQPEAVALSRCGKRVAVLAEQRSVYNVFSLDRNGSLGELEFIYKDVHIRHPACEFSSMKPTLVFQSDGTLQCSTDDGRSVVTYTPSDGTLVPLFRKVNAQKARPLPPNEGLGSLV